MSDDRVGRAALMRREMDRLRRHLSVEGRWALTRARQGLPLLVMGFPQEKEPLDPFDWRGDEGKCWATMEYARSALRDLEAAYPPDRRDEWPSLRSWLEPLRGYLDLLERALAEGSPVAVPWAIALGARLAILGKFLHWGPLVAAGWELRQGGKRGADRTRPKRANPARDLILAEITKRREAGATGPDSKIIRRALRTVEPELRRRGLKVPAPRTVRDWLAEGRKKLAD